MNDLLLYNAKILDVNNHDNIISDNNIIGISNGQIKFLDNSNNISSEYFSSLKSQSKQFLDLQGQWVTPGLIDCHTHLVYAGSRSNEFAARLAGSSYEEITKAGGGIKATVRDTRAIAIDDLIKISEARLKQIISSGITTIEIKSGYGLDFESEQKILQVADYLEKKYPITIQKTFLGAHMVPAEFADNPERYIEYLTEQVLPDLYSNNLVDAVDGFCEHIAFSASQLEPLYKKARELGLKIKGHTEQLSNIGGGELICKYNGLSCDHLEYADEKIAELLAESNTVAVLLPGAFYYLNETQKPPVEYFRKHKVAIAVATDFNPGTSPIISLITIMNMACVLYKLTPLEVWQGVTINAAKALGLADQIGSIELNKAADLVIWDCEHPYDICYYMNYDWNKKVIKNRKFINI